MKNFQFLRLQLEQCWVISEGDDVQLLARTRHNIADGDVSKIGDAAILEFCHLSLGQDQSHGLPTFLPDHVGFWAEGFQDPPDQLFAAVQARVKSRIITQVRSQAIHELKGVGKIHGL